MPLIAFDHDGERFFDDGVWCDYDGDTDERVCRHGTGEMTWEDGDLYVGEWKNHMIDGSGIFCNANDGSTYEGEFKASKKDGKRNISFSNGDMYKGG